MLRFLSLTLLVSNLAFGQSLEERDGQDNGWFTNVLSDIAIGGCQIDNFLRPGGREYPYLSRTLNLLDIATAAIDVPNFGMIGVHCVHRRDIVPLADPLDPTGPHKWIVEETFRYGTRFGLVAGLFYDRGFDQTYTIAYEVPSKQAGEAMPPLAARIYRNGFINSLKETDENGNKIFPEEYVVMREIRGEKLGDFDPERYGELRNNLDVSNRAAGVSFDDAVLAAFGEAAGASFTPYAFEFSSDASTGSRIVLSVKSDTVTVADIYNNRDREEFRHFMGFIPVNFYSTATKPTDFYAGVSYLFDKESLKNKVVADYIELAMEGNDLANVLAMRAQDLSGLAKDTRNFTSNANTLDQDSGILTPYYQLDYSETNIRGKDGSYWTWGEADSMQTTSFPFVSGDYHIGIHPIGYQKLSADPLDLDNDPDEIQIPFVAINLNYVDSNIEAHELFDFEGGNERGILPWMDIIAGRSDTPKIIQPYKPAGLTRDTDEYQRITNPYLDGNSRNNFAATNGHPFLLDFDRLWGLASHNNTRTHMLQFPGRDIGDGSATVRVVFSQRAIDRILEMTDAEFFINLAHVTRRTVESTQIYSGDAAQIDVDKNRPARLRGESMASWEKRIADWKPFNNPEWIPNPSSKKLWDYPIHHFLGDWGFFGKPWRDFYNPEDPDAHIRASGHFSFVQRAVENGREFLRQIRKAKRSSTLKEKIVALAKGFRETAKTRGSNVLTLNFNIGVDLFVLGAVTRFVIDGRPYDQVGDDLFYEAELDFMGPEIGHDKIVKKRFNGKFTFGKPFKVVDAPYIDPQMSEPGDLYYLLDRVHN